MLPFFSNTDYIISPGITFPIKEVLGIIVYSTSKNDYQLSLGQVEIIRSRRYEHYKIILKFKNSNGAIQVICSTEPYINYTKDCLDYKLDLYNVSGSYCGCIVVTKIFIQWLFRTVLFNLDNINPEALYINPTFIHSLGDPVKSSFRVNGQEVDQLVFDNAYIDEGCIYINNKLRNTEEPDSPSHLMTALRIKSSGGSVVLKGESIGFTITPPSSNELFCRVHIETTPDTLTFIDQSTGL